MYKKRHNEPNRDRQPFTCKVKGEGACFLRAEEERFRTLNAARKGQEPAAQGALAASRGRTSVASRGLPQGGFAVPTAQGRRRRGSVLILVVTLLGILFVTGIAFLSTMNFEAEMIAVERQRSRRATGVDTVVGTAEAILRDGMTGGLGFSINGKLEAPFRDNASPVPSGASVNAMGELPGVHNFFAPIEPYELSPGQFVFPWFTDLLGLTREPFTGTAFRDVAVPAGLPLQTGVQVDVDGDGVKETLDTQIVDADGDGVTDTIAFALADLGFSDEQIAPIAERVNKPSNPDGRAFLGLRIIAHGGMVNLNESHPSLVANVFDISVDDLLTGRDPLGGSPAAIRHRPSSNLITEKKSYSPRLEEAMLRRRVLLPPREVPPSLLEGNALLDAGNSIYGDADLPELFAPGAALGLQTPLQTVYEQGHRYWPFTLARDANNDFEEWFDPLDHARAPLWAGRMEPLLSLTIDPTGASYDRRHLVTTVSYDDLLSRGGRATFFERDGRGQLILDNRGKPTLLEDDLVTIMRRANVLGTNNFGQCPTVLAFEYANYPQTIPNNPECLCANESQCRFDDVKGRLQLSLPWLDEAFAGGDLTAPERQRLIHDVFFLLVRNARGPYWEDVNCSFNTSLCEADEVCMPADPPRCVGGANDGQPCALDSECLPGSCALSLCQDPITGQTHRALRISRTAAALTANMLDYMDRDDRPTRVALRSFDFDNPRTAGQPFGLGGPGSTPQYVYGLERQPYITEVATVIGDPGTGPGEVTARAVELFNPYDENLGPDSDGDGVTDYWLVELNPGDARPGGGRPPIPLLNPINRGEFTVFTSGNADFGTITGPGLNFNLTSGSLEFQNESIIYLVHKFQYDGRTVDVVVDQFRVDGKNIGKRFVDLEDKPDLSDPDTPAKLVYSLQRFVRDDLALQWKMTVPATEERKFEHTLQNWNTPVNDKLLPVEVNFANTGSFAAPDSFAPQRGVAFPTTGSILLLMRYANRSLDDFSDASKDLAFTTRLDDVTKVGVAGSQLDLPESEQVDNGRMPVFDVGKDFGGFFGRQYAHHVNPADNPPDSDPLSPPQRLAKPGDLGDLPWGQLVFDYFTALPLSSFGPYDDPRRVQPNNVVVSPFQDAIPRVDENGLRVHGRININAAPWKVLAGLPLIPMEKIPESFRNKIRSGAGVSVTDDQAAQLGTAVAQAIVAYRELRAVANSGDYRTGAAAPGLTGTPPFGRGWTLGTPAVRRGTGFLSEGELANVRHSGAPNAFRIDGGELEVPDVDFVSAAARLIALGDWVTTRSHVFTIYGTVRGEEDPSITDPNPNVQRRLRAEDIDRRAIRFRETVDRLPVFFGAVAPARIGERFVGQYVDFQND